MLLGDSAYGSGEAWAERRGADPIIHNPAGPAANPCQQALTCPQAATGAGNAARQQADPRAIWDKGTQPNRSGSICA